MKTRLFTPGPTPVPEETLLELAKPVGYHRAAEAKAILAEVTEDLKYVFQTANPVVTLTSSGTGGMESAVCSRGPVTRASFFTSTENSTSIDVSTPVPVGSPSAISAWPSPMNRSPPG